jgi:hypothetical protein
MSCELKVPEFPSPEEQLAALGGAIVQSYRELIMEGQLSAYFTVVRGGMMDAAQALTDQVEGGIAAFQDKITEIIRESEYFKAANKTITEMKVAVEAFTVIMESLEKAPQPVPQGKAESGTPA